MTPPSRCLSVGLRALPSMNIQPNSMSFLSAVRLRCSGNMRQSTRCVQQRRFASNPIDEEGWSSVLDKPPTLVQANRKHRPIGLALLALIPATAFALGTWQVKRLHWKTDLIAKYEDRLVRPPLPLPPIVNIDRLDEFDYRRVEATGRFRHDQEMFLGPRIHEGENGYQLVTPMERPNGTKILVNRGWIAKDKRDPKKRDPAALPEEEVTVQGLLRSGWKRNRFTPENRPDLNEFYFPDIEQMAALVRAQPVWIEETMEPDLVATLDRQEKGIPIGRPTEVNLRNNHLQYIVTWYALSAATTIMFWMLVRKKPSDVARRVRRQHEWT